MEKEFKSMGTFVCPIVSTSVEDFITTVNTYCYHYLKTGESTGPSTLYPTTPELNEQLKDTPENQKNWEKIYRGIPEPFLVQTARMWGPQTSINDPDDLPWPTTGIIVLNRIDSMTPSEKKELLSHAKERTNS